MKILRRFKKSDFYTGMIVASDNNPNYLYELCVYDDYISYRSIAFVGFDGTLVKHEGGWFNTKMYGFWCESEDSRKLDPVSRREDKLKELGI